MKTHTHRGNCQACGALQAMARGGQPLALHGYVVAGWGFFNGTCPGSRKLPLQLDRSYADEIVTTLTQRAAEALERVELYRSGALTPSRVDTNKMVKLVSGKWGAETISWAEANEYQRRDAVIACIRNDESNARHSAAHAKQLARLADELLGTAPIPVTPKARPVAVNVGQKFDLYGQQWEVASMYDGRRAWCVPTAGAAAARKAHAIRLRDIRQVI